MSYLKFLFTNVVNNVSPALPDHYWEGCNKFDEYLNYIIENKSLKNERIWVELIKNNYTSLSHIISN